MVWDAVLFNQCDEIGMCIAGQCRFAEMWIGREEIPGLAMDVGEVASSTARDQYLFPDALGTLDERNPPSVLTGFDGTHQPGSTAAENDSIEIFARRCGHTGIVTGQAGRMKPSPDTYDRVVFMPPLWDSSYFFDLLPSIETLG